MPGTDPELRHLGASPVLRFGATNRQLGLLQRRRQHTMNSGLRPASPFLEKIRLPVLNPAASLADVNYEFVKRKVAQGPPKPGTHWRQIKKSAVAGLEHCHVWL